MPEFLRGVIFDCDGTLLDSIGVWHEVESNLACRANAQLSRAEVDELTTLTIPEVGAFFHERYGLGESAADVVEMIDASMLDFYQNRAEARPGALAFVQALAERGVVMSVASSSPQAYLQAGLAHTGFLPYLCAVVSVDEVGKSKREPAVFDRAREIMGTAREATWGFEDSTYALRTLRDAGYPTVGIYDCDESGTWEDLSATATHAIKSFEHLTPEIFDRWNSDR